MTTRTVYQYDDTPCISIMMTHYVYQYYHYDNLNTVYKYDVTPSISIINTMTMTHPVYLYYNDTPCISLKDESRS